jgi:hypothetical protein
MFDNDQELKYFIDPQIRCDTKLNWNVSALHWSKLVLSCSSFSKEPLILVLTIKKKLVGFFGCGFELDFSKF